MATSEDRREFLVARSTRMGRKEASGAAAMERLNNRSRKRLGFLIPGQVFFNSGVAFYI